MKAEKNIPHRCENQYKICTNTCWVSEIDLIGNKNSYFIICSICDEEGKREHEQYKRRLENARTLSEGAGN